MSSPIAGLYKRNAPSVVAPLGMRWQVMDHQWLKCTVCFMVLLQRPYCIRYNGFLLHQLISSWSPLFTRFYASLVVMEFSHQRYVSFRIVAQMSCSFFWWNLVTSWVTTKTWQSWRSNMFLLRCRWSGKRCMVNLRHQNLFVPIELQFF